MEDSSKKTLSQLLSDFLIKQKRVLVASAVVIIVAIVAIGVVNNLASGNRARVIDSVSELDQIYEDSLTEKVDSLDFVKFAEKLITEDEGTIAELMAYSRLGSYYFDNEDYGKAFENYTNAYTKFPNDLASSTYMFNAAMALDELDREEEAIEVLELLVETYKSTDVKVGDISGDIPEALFNLGRLYESNGNLEKAISSYEVLVAEYQSYNLANFAKSRLIEIK